MAHMFPKCNAVRLPAMNETTLQLNNPDWVRQRVELSFSLGLVPMLECHSSTGNEPLSASFDWWRRADIKQIALDYPAMWVNIANEHNFGSTAEFRDTYRNFIVELRNLGYKNLIVLDGHANTGNKIEGIVEHGEAIVTGDPLHNVVFSVHPYTFWYDPDVETPPSWAYNMNTAMDTLAGLNVPVVLGEFGIKGGSSHYLGELPYVGLTVAQKAEARGLGWYGWGWHDKNTYAAFNVVMDVNNPIGSITAHGTALRNYVAGLTIAKAQGLPAGNNHGFTAITTAV